MIRVRQIKIKVSDNNQDNIVKGICLKLKINKNDILCYNIVKRSIDARHRDNVYFIYDLDVNVRDITLIKFNDDIFISPDRKYKFNLSGNILLDSRPVIVGSGPCGLFCAYELALNGFCPIVVERGEDMDSRVKTVNDFWNNNNFKSNSNVQFGEGGAGTFSDGKLSTQIKDKNNRINEVLNVFYEHGAPADILYDFMPHIGTDKLRDVVKNMRNEIISLGGEFRYNSCMTDLNISNGKVRSIILNNEEVIDTSIVILAIGHSARDTFRMLNSRGVSISNKPFAVGMRVMHLQDFINKNQYGDYYKYLKPASYKLTYNSKNGRGVYSFCMCPGGYVVNASSENNKLVVNGMSNYERESGIANSAILVTVSEKDYGTSLFDGVRFQETLERKAFEIGRGFIPVQKYSDYLNHTISSKFDTIFPAIKGSYNFADLNLLFSDDINNAFKDGMKYFGQRIKGFDNDDVILAGVESRSSSPIKIYRDENFESNILGLYPAGEGAGYAGGIVSSAVDGIKVFESIASKYKYIKK